MIERIDVPTRNLLSVVAHNDQRVIKFLENLGDTVNVLSDAVVSGSGGILDMGDRMTTDTLYDGGSRV